MNIKDRVIQEIEKYDTYGLVSDFFEEIEKILKSENIDSKNLSISVNEKEIRVSWIQFNNVIEVIQRRK